MEPQRRQLIVEWGHAADAVLDLVHERRAAEAEVVVVGVTGPVGAGKSTLATRLGGTRIATDDYLPDYDRVPERLRDHPGQADLPLLREHLELLRAGLAAEVPTWCFQTHRRTGSRPVASERLVVCEGIFALAEPVREVVDVAVFVEAPGEHRRARWERLELEGERGWGVEHARRYMEQVADPTFAEFAAEYRRAADIIVRNPNRTE